MQKLFNHALYYDINSRQRMKDWKADDRGEPGCESRRFDSLTNDKTKTFGLFMSVLFPSNSLTLYTNILI